MVKRKRIILIFNHNQNWIGGSYYILNLICALNYLEDSKKPEIYILSSPEDFKKVQTTNYPYLYHFIESEHIQPINVSQRIINKLSWTIFKKDIYIPQIIDIDAVFPISWEIKLPINPDKLIYWIPDFQEKYFPVNFDTNEIKIRNMFQLNLAKTKNKIVFSSTDAFNDFEKYLPNHLNKTFVLNFAVSHQKNVSTSFEELKNKFLIRSHFFYCPNQFWSHKNHITVFKAVLLAKSEIPNIQIVFTGNTNDPRNPEHFHDLELFIKENSLEENIKILGFVAREEQISLYKNSIAIIQPSLFEGWNTSIEDAKYFNQFVIASEINVHKEQLETNFELFPKQSAEFLSKLLIGYYKTPPNVIQNDYNIKIDKFATDFMNIIEK